jgi:hypothetical protein
MNNDMDMKIKNIIQDLKKSNNLTHALDCINFIVNKEILIDDDNVLKKQDAIRFFKERYNMQSFLKDSKLKIIEEKLIEIIEKLDNNDEIIIIDITEEKNNYLIFKRKNEDEIFYILKGFDNLNKKKNYINVLLANSWVNVIGISHYNKGELLKYYK